MLIAKKTIKQIATLVLIGKTVLIKSGIVENNRNSTSVKYSNIEILLSVGVIVSHFSFSFLFSFFFFSIYMLFASECI